MQALPGGVAFPSRPCKGMDARRGWMPPLPDLPSDCPGFPGRACHATLFEHDQTKGNER